MGEIVIRQKMLSTGKTVYQLTAKESGNPKADSKQKKKQEKQVKRLNVYMKKLESL